MNLLLVKLKSSVAMWWNIATSPRPVSLLARIFLWRFDVMHAHNPPDTFFLVALPFKLLGKEFVFNQHDRCPEPYRSRYRAAEGFASRLLRILEWCSLKLADVTIATNESYKRIQIERGNKNPRDVFIVRNGPNQMRMTPVAPGARLRGMNKCILCCIGNLNPQQCLSRLGSLAHG